MHPDVETLDQAWSQGGGNGYCKPAEVPVRDFDEHGILLVNQEPALKEVAVEVLDEGVLSPRLVLIRPLTDLDQVPYRVVDIAVVLHVGPGFLLGEGQDSVKLVSTLGQLDMTWLETTPLLDWTSGEPGTLALVIL